MKILSILRCLHSPESKGRVIASFQWSSTTPRASLGRELAESAGWATPRREQSGRMVLTYGQSTVRGARHPALPTKTGPNLARSQLPLRTAAGALAIPGGATAADLAAIRAPTGRTSLPQQRAEPRPIHLDGQAVRCLRANAASSSGLQVIDPSRRPARMALTHRSSASVTARMYSVSSRETRGSARSTMSAASATSSSAIRWASLSCRMASSS